MNILIKTIGSPDLSQQIRSMFALGGEAHSSRGHGNTICAQDALLPRAPRGLACASDALTILVVDAANAALMSQLQSLHKQLKMALLDSRALPLRSCPIIAVVPPTTDRRLPPQLGPADDWLFADRLHAELYLRVAACIDKCLPRDYKLSGGRAFLTQSSKTLDIDGRCLKLSPSEYSLAEHFFDRMGSIVTLNDLISLFATAGKSPAMNNIRVAIYQLRVKLEELSERKLTIATVYRKGYVLRQCQRLLPTNMQHALVHYAN